MRRVHRVHRPLVPSLPHLAPHVRRGPAVQERAHDRLVPRGRRRVERLHLGFESPRGSFAQQTWQDVTSWCALRLESLLPAFAPVRCLTHFTPAVPCALPGWIAEGLHAGLRRHGEVRGRELGDRADVTHRRREHLPRTEIARRCKT